MKKILFILLLSGLVIGCQKQTSEVPAEIEMQTESAHQSSALSLNVSAVAESDGAHLVSWNGAVSTQLHTVVIRMWFGKKKMQGQKYYPIAVWAHWNPFSGSDSLSGTRVIYPHLYEPNWRQVNYEGYICQFGYVGSPPDQYQCFDSNTFSLTKK